MSFREWDGLKKQKCFSVTLFSFCMSSLLHIIVLNATFMDTFQTLCLELCYLITLFGLEGGVMGLLNPSVEQHLLCGASQTSTLQPCPSRKENKPKKKDGVLLCFGLPGLSRFWWLGETIQGHSQRKSIAQSGVKSRWVQGGNGKYSTTAHW